jgi:hypothetical protein
MIENVGQHAPATPHHGEGATVAVVTPDAVEAGDYCELCASLSVQHRNMRFRSEIYSPAWVQCDGCDKWLHQVCEGIIDPEHQERLKNSDEPYTCVSCLRNRPSPDSRSRTLQEMPKKRVALILAKKVDRVPQDVPVAGKVRQSTLRAYSQDCLSDDALMSLLGLGCKYGMGPDLPAVTRDAIARIVEDLKKEHDTNVNKPRCGQHVKVNGRRCKLLAWCRHNNAVVVYIDGDAEVVMEAFVVPKSTVDRT